MRLQGRSVAEVLVDADTITDATILSVEIGIRNGATAIRIELAARAGSRFDRIKLTFIGITDYGFYGSGDLSERVVVHHKFTVTEDSTYISLDPFDPGNVEPEDQDNFFVLAWSVEAELTHR